MDEKTSSKVSRLPETGFLRIKHIIGDPKNGLLPIVPVCKATWWNGVKTGRFPAPVALGPNTRAWRVEDIRRLVEELAADAAEGDEYHEEI